MAQPQTRPATGVETVTVACKIPQGLTLQLHEKRELKVASNHGVSIEERHFPVEGQTFTLNGSAHPQNQGPRCRVVGAFAITNGVPKDFWDKWMDQVGQYHPAMKSGMIIAYPDVDRTVDAAKERRKIVTGLERLNPHKLPVFNQNFALKTADDTPSEVKAQLDAAELD